eukprot:Gregarina_sp_Pseudo_9__116@NODE_107_length_4228_cov_101_740272_g99_i0_p1_GENE_NODE_107_length_4228_cov_101_740272_g99_i0NODE_107_length_4228_cov_101_740272_g99_i0_p1_ORF_typecomplete_len782_score173_08GST_C_3/PF14497_6/0_003GST_C_3/PF14497_6/0_55GST_C_3/PF14497_6/6_9e06GST_N/PF02798_20/1_1e05GST_N/PF02798_20/0_00041GST_N_3/PF13417_6/1_8e03GST_N_3/PF13417_6/0_052GST_N_3/PF13417_6/4_1e03GST_N_3/PF13417_6/0_19GST_N_4/PF17172_4/0_077GST_N_4/PF17172_4/7_8e03GST_N_4/PF17172_4/85Tom37/PF10568_9/0_0097T
MTDCPQQPDKESCCEYDTSIMTQQEFANNDPNSCMAFGPCGARGRPYPFMGHSFPHMPHCGFPMHGTPPCGFPMHGMQPCGFPMHGTPPQWNANLPPTQAPPQMPGAPQWGQPGAPQWGPCAANQWHFGAGRGGFPPRGRGGMFGGPRGGFRGRFHPWTHQEGDCHTVPTLYYSDGAGLAEPLRLCFILGDVPFVDKRMTPQQWQTKYKTMSPTGSMPFLTVGHTSFSQSRAMLLYASRRANLLPVTPQEQLQALTMSSIILDSTAELIRVTLAAKPEDRMTAAFVHLKNVVIPEHWVRLNAMVQAAQTQEGYALGGRTTYVDACVAGMMYSMFCRVRDTPAEAVLLEVFESQLPVLKKIMGRVYHETRVVAAMRKNPPSPTITYQAGCWQAEALTRYMDMYALKYKTKEIATEDWDKAAMPILPWIDSGYGSVGGLHSCFGWIEQWIMNRGEVGSLAQFKTDEEVTRFHSCMELLSGVIKMFASGSASQEALLSELAALNKVVSQTQHSAGFIMGNSPTFLDALAAVLCRKLSMEAHQFEIPREVMNYLRQSFKVFMSHPEVRSAKLARIPKPKLVYFDSPAMVEGCRLMFHVAGVPFEDIALEFSEWPPYKAQSATGTAPWLEVGPNKYYEALVINKIVAELTRLMPDTFKGRHEAETLASFYYTTISNKTTFIAPGANKPDQRIAYWKEHQVPLCDQLETMIRRVQVNPSHAVENSFTWIDFFLAGAYEFEKALQVVGEEEESRWTSWKKIYDTVYALPQVQAYVSTLGPRISPLAEF